MKHPISLDGQERGIDIRAMDETFIMYDKLWEAPLMRQQLPEPEPGTPAHVVQEFFRKQMRAIGSCLILAWDGDGLVGKMHFTTREMSAAIGDPGPGGYCVDPDPDYRGRFAQKLQTLSDEDVDRLLKSDSQTLRVLCFNIGHVDQRYHGQGIATAMLEYLKEWARDRGWRHLEMRSCPDIVPASVVGSWRLRRGQLERRGFRVLEEIPLEPEEIVARRHGIEEMARTRAEDWPERDTWYVENFRRLYTNDRQRSAYDRDYLMACDL